MKVIQNAIFPSILEVVRKHPPCSNNCLRVDSRFVSSTNLALLKVGYILNLAILMPVLISTQTTQQTSKYEYTSSGGACFAKYRLIWYLNLWKRIDKQGVRNKHRYNRSFTSGSTEKISILDHSCLAPAIHSKIQISEEDSQASQPRNTLLATSTSIMFEWLKINGRTIN